MGLEHEECTANSHQAPTILSILIWFWLYPFPESTSAHLRLCRRCLGIGGFSSSSTTSFGLMLSMEFLGGLASIQFYISLWGHSLAGMWKDISRVQILLCRQRFFFQFSCEKVVPVKTLPEATPMNRSGSDCVTEAETGYSAGSEVIYAEDKS